jgi:hypothetical protein
MKDFVLNLRRIIGEETDTGFVTDLVSGDKTLNVPNFTYKDQEAVYPKSVLSAFVDYRPVARGENFKTIQTKVQVDILTKDDVQCIDITEAIDQRFLKFFKCDIIEYIDPYEWESTDATDVGIYINPNYNSERQIIKVSNYIKVTSIEELRASENTWMINDDGLYVHGEYVKAMITEVIDGLVFPNGETVLERGFSGLNPNTSMKEIPAEEFTTTRFMLEYEIFYNVYQGKNTIGELDVIGVKESDD